MEDKMKLEHLMLGVILIVLILIVGWLQFN